MDYKIRNYNNMENLVMHTIAPLFLGAIMITISISLIFICFALYKEIKNY